MISAIPSELLEPVLVRLLDWHLQELVESQGTDADWQRYFDCVKFADRFVICNRVDAGDDPTGIHASLAMNTEQRRVMDLQEDPALRQSVYEALRAGRYARQ